MIDRETNDNNDVDHMRRNRSVFLGPSPLDVFTAAIILTAIAVSLLAPIVQTIRSWFR